MAQKKTWKLFASENVQEYFAGAEVFFCRSIDSWGLLAHNEVASEAGELKAQAGACDSSGRLEGMVVFWTFSFILGGKMPSLGVFFCFFFSSQSTLLPYP